MLINRQVVSNSKGFSIREEKTLFKGKTNVSFFSENGSIKYFKNQFAAELFLLELKKQPVSGQQSSEKIILNNKIQPIKLPINSVINQTLDKNKYEHNILSNRPKKLTLTLQKKACN